MTRRRHHESSKAEEQHMSRCDPRYKHPASASYIDAQNPEFGNASPDQGYSGRVRLFQGDTPTGRTHVMAEGREMSHLHRRFPVALQHVFSARPTLSLPARDGAYRDCLIAHVTWRGGSSIRIDVPAMNPGRRRGHGGGEISRQTPEDDRERCIVWL